jgi:hypothetical protein
MALESFESHWFWTRISVVVRIGSRWEVDMLLSISGSHRHLLTIWTWLLLLTLQGSTPLVTLEGIRRDPGTQASFLIANGEVR